MNPPAPSGDDMGSTLTLVETARIEALLALLDPDAGGPCQVPGCTHAAPRSLGRRERDDRPGGVARPTARGGRRGPAAPPAAASPLKGVGASGGTSSTGAGSVVGHVAGEAPQEHALDGAPVAGGHHQRAARLAGPVARRARGVPLQQHRLGALEPAGEVRRARPARPPSPAGRRTAPTPPTALPSETRKGGGATTCTTLSRPRQARAARRRAPGPGPPRRTRR